MSIDLIVRRLDGLALEIFGIWSLDTPVACDPKLPLGKKPQKVKQTVSKGRKNSGGPGGLQGLGCPDYP